MTKRLLARALAVWLLIILAETIHGTLRTLLLVPLMGDFPARQVSVFTGAVVIFTVAWFTHRWMWREPVSPSVVIPSDAGKSRHSQSQTGDFAGPGPDGNPSSFPANPTKNAVIPSDAIKGRHSREDGNPSSFLSNPTKNAVIPSERSDEESAFPPNPTYAIGTLWVALTITFEITLGRALGMPWSRILEDHNLLQGGLMPLGLIALWATPWLVARLRR
jgi:hypothetical protein